MKHFGEWIAFLCHNVGCSRLVNFKYDPVSAIHPVCRAA